MVVEEIGKKRGVKLEIMIFGFCFYGELEKNGSMNRSVTRL